ncbi:facilitated trehalose transporter Tret1-like [Athalia rosae]|uniref:facilitated trehalose transporter Tret1-like n=1 Tax=Athalia rosae TaxID=37344 RepID=UPI002033CDF8|nr:facilitated trehalose transporter Tret1-like [Athalia rosae]
MESTGMINGRPIQQEGRKLWQYMATISGCLLSVGAGTILSWTSPVLPKLNSPSAWLYVNEEQGSWVGSLMAIGAIIGAVPAGGLADKLGRKKTILATAIPYITGWIMITFANNVLTLYFARLLGGIGVGATCVLVPMYIAEIAEPAIRGVLGSIFQLCISAGVLYGFVVGAIVSYTGLAIICCCVEIAFLASFFWMPESPVWLMCQGRKTEASKALKIFRGEDYDVNEELAAMQKSAEETASRKSSPADLINTKGARTALFSGLGLLALQQLTGINAVIFYGSTIFAAAGSSMAPDLASIVIALVQCVMSVIAAFIVDRVGRRVLLVFSSSVLALCLFFLGLYFQLNLTSMGWLPLLCLTLFMVAFAVGYGPVPWMMVGELFPPETKGLASVIAVIINWGTSFLVTKFFATLKEAYGDGVTFWLFAGIMVGATAFGFFVVPETRGKSLQQIQDELNGKVRNTIA